MGTNLDRNGAKFSDLAFALAECASIRVSIHQLCLRHLMGEVGGVSLNVCISSGSLAFAFAGGSDTEAQLESSPFDIIRTAEHQDRIGSP